MNILFGFVFVLGAAVNFLFFYKPMLSSNGIQYITAVCLSLMLAGLGTLWLYIIVKFALIKTNRSFREENNQRFIENARRFFETNRMPDGAFFESEEIKKASKFSNLLSWFLLLLIVAIGLTFIFINNFSRQMGYLGLVLVIISAVSFIAWVIKKIRLADKQVSRPGAKFRLYQDRFIILPENITLRFKDVEAIDFNNSVDLFKANIIFHHTDHYFTLYSGGYTILVNSNRYKAALDLPYFLEHLGFVKHQGVQKKRYIYQKF